MNPQSPATPTRGLPSRLRSGTRLLHQQAERAGVMAQLLGGRIDAQSYVQLLHNLLVIYRSLEDALVRHQDHPALALVFNPALARSAALAADIAALGDTTGCAPRAECAPATLAYVAQLQAISAADAHRLVAHAYVRYLGDLSGGQMLRRMLLRSATLAPSGALHFYDFGDEPTVARLVAQFRAGLAAVEQVESRLDDIVDEAITSFHLHVRLFDELAAASPMAAT